MVSKDVRNGADELIPSPAAPDGERPRRGIASLLAIIEEPGRRLALAVAISLAIHEVAAMLWPAARPAPKRTETIAAVVTIEKRTPAPTPVPTPKPTPRPPIPTPPPQTPPPHPSFAPRVTVRAPAPAAILPRRRLTGGRTTRRVAMSTPRPVATSVPVATAVPVAVRADDGAGTTGTTAGTGAGPGAGTSGLGGAASGVSGTGAGDGSDTNGAPCGSVDFYPVHTQTAPDGSQTVEVEMDVTMRAGTTERDTLGWRWHYPSIAANPFNAKNSEDSISMQLPPPGYDMSQLKPAIAYAIRHTSPEGILAFEPCP